MFDRFLDSVHQFRSEDDDIDEEGMLDAEPYFKSRFPKLRAFTCWHPTTLAKDLHMESDINWAFLQPAYGVGTVDDMCLWAILKGRHRRIRLLRICDPTHMERADVPVGQCPIVPFVPTASSQISKIDVTLRPNSGTVSSLLNGALALASYFGRYWARRSSDFACAREKGKVRTEAFNATSIVVYCGGTPLEVEHCMRAV